MKLTLVGDVVVAGWPRDSVRGVTALGLLAGGDVTIGNLEVPFTARGFRAEKLVAMRAPTSGAEELASMGFDLMSLSTNHALDFGSEGMRETVEALDAAGVQHAGFGENAAEALAPAVVTVGDQSLAFISLCSALPLGYNATSRRPGIGGVRVRQTFEFDSTFIEETPGIPPFVHSTAHEPDVLAAEAAVRDARRDHDVVVVALHWGVPAAYLPAVQGPLAEYQRPLAHRLIDAGADVVLGSHSHGLHPVEFHGNGLILYSTGNFVFDWCEGWGPTSMVAEADAHPSAPYHPVLVNNSWFESAVFRVEVGDGMPRLRLDPIELDENSQPILPRPEVAASILSNVAEASRMLDPSIVIDPDGMVRRV